MTSRNWRRLNAAMPWLVIIGLLVVWQAIVDFFGIAAFVLKYRLPNGAAPAATLLTAMLRAAA